MIDQIMNAARFKKTILLTGYYGISKTFSTLLFSILSDHIIKYKMSIGTRNPVEKISS
jgi:hypothetical protein